MLDLSQIDQLIDSLSRKLDALHHITDSPSVSSDHGSSKSIVASSNMSVRNIKSLQQGNTIAAALEQKNPFVRRFPMFSVKNNIALYSSNTTITNDSTRSPEMSSDFKTPSEVSIEEIDAVDILQRLLKQDKDSYSNVFLDDDAEELDSIEPEMYADKNAFVQSDKEPMDANFFVANNIKEFDLGNRFELRGFIKGEVSSGTLKTNPFVKKAQNALQTFLQQKSFLKSDIAEINSRTNFANGADLTVSDFYAFYKESSLNSIDALRMCSKDNGFFIDSWGSPFVVVSRGVFAVISSFAMGVLNTGLSRKFLESFGSVVHLTPLCSDVEHGICSKHSFVKVFSHNDFVVLGLKSCQAKNIPLCHRCLSIMSAKLQKAEKDVSVKLVFDFAKKLTKNDPNNR